MSKECSKCGEDKALSEFSPQRGRSHGVRSRCKPCTSADNMDRYRRNRETLSALKLERGCVRCGYNEHSAALHWDHLDPTEKAFNIGESTSNSGLKRLLAETDKCQVLCANCHAIKTWHEADY